MSEINNKRKRYYHAPVTYSTEIEYRGVKATILRDGKVKITKDNEDDTFDEITVSANFIYKLAERLNLTKKVEFEND